MRLADSQKDVQALERSQKHLHKSVVELQSELSQSHQSKQRYRGGPMEGWIEPTDMQEMRDKMVISQTKLQVYQDEISRLKIANDAIPELEKRLAAFQEQLHACKDELFRLQPASQIPDTEMLRDFETMSRKIIHWVDTEVDSFEETHPETKPGHIFSVGNDNEARGFLQSYPDLGEYMARYLIIAICIRHFLRNTCSSSGYRSMRSTCCRTHRRLWKIIRRLKVLQAPNDSSPAFAMADSE